MTAILGVLVILCSHADCASPSRDLPAGYLPIPAPITSVLAPGLPGQSCPIPDPNREIVAGPIEPSDDDDTTGSAHPTGFDLPGPSGILRFHPAAPVPAPRPPRTFCRRLRC